MHVVELLATEWHSLNEVLYWLGSLGEQDRLDILTCSPYMALPLPTVSINRDTTPSRLFGALISETCILVSGTWHTFGRPSIQYLLHLNTIPLNCSLQNLTGFLLP